MADVEERRTTTVRRSAISPAVYSKELIVPLTQELYPSSVQGGRLLDPFGGLGYRFASIALALEMEPVAVEIEPGYRLAGQQHPCVILGDSRYLPFEDNFFDAAVTSPAYPNGISDAFRSNEGSKRHTYVHRLREWLGDDYELRPGNAGGTNPRRSPKALESFYDIHSDVWAEVYRVLKPGARFVVNTKDPIAVPFRTDTRNQLIEAGFEFLHERQVAVGGLNHGKNHDRKHSFEDITVVVKPTKTGEPK